jgi:hypothetical protein
MFLDSGTPYYVAPSYRDNERVGQWQGWAKDAATALDVAIRIANGRVTIGQPRRLTPGEIAAVITGADVRGFV